MHYTTSCNTQSNAPEDGPDQRPKHVELTGIINKPLLLHLVGVYTIYINDARSNKYQICTTSIALIKEQRLGNWMCIRRQAKSFGFTHLVVLVKKNSSWYQNPRPSYLRRSLSVRPERNLVTRLVTEYRLFSSDPSYSYPLEELLGKVRPIIPKIL